MSDAKTKRTDLTREETEKFINYYLNQECLWNLRHEFYSKREHRQAALLMIPQQMAMSGREMSVDQVTSKIASLRTYYGRELRKTNASEKSGASSADVYISPWEFFPLLDPFLRSHVQQRVSQSNMIINKVCMTIDEPGEITGESTPSLLSANLETTDVHETSENPRDFEDLDVGVPKRKQHKSSSTCTQENLQALMFRTLTNLDQRKAEKPAGLGDPDVLFGQQVGLELKQIPNKKRRQELKLKIQGLIFQYQFENEA